MENSKEGFWQVTYVNDERHQGVGIAVFDTGIVVGCGVMGDVWNGKYEYNKREDEIDIDVTITFPKGVISNITGITSSNDSYTENLKFSLPRFQNEKTVRTPVKTPQGTLSLFFKKLRDFPNI